MKDHLDSYAIRARYFPVVLVVLPAAVALVPWIPTESVQWRILISLAVSAPAVVLLSHFGRDLGKRQQVKLFAKWGGSPTIRMLRHRDTTLSDATRDRYRTILEKIVPGIELPSARSERAKPDEADAIYASCTDYLRERTRDKTRFRLLFEENVSYGFRRNLWAMKPAGIALSLGGLGATGWMLKQEMAAGQSPSATVLAGMVVAALMLTWWLLRIRESWVEAGANAYAERLLAACDTLNEEQSHSAK